MAQKHISTPLLNNNEDSVRITEWHCQPGDHLESGELLVTLETSKVAQEIRTDQAGYLRWICAEEFANVGDTLAVLTDLPEETVTLASSDTESTEPDARRVTVKARVLAKRLKVDVNAIVGQRITEQMVREFAGSSANSPAAIPSSVSLDELLADAPRGMATVIIGDSYHATYVHETSQRADSCYVVGCTSNALPIGSRVGEMQVIGSDDDLKSLFDRGITRALVGVGSSRDGTRSNEGRRRIYENLKALGFALPAVIDPDASFAHSATVEEGTVIGAGAVVSTNVRIGANCLINVGAVVCHEVTIENHVHVTPGAILAGTVRVGQGSTIGMAATVLDGTTIGKNCLVPNGFRVIADLADDQIAPHV